MGDFRLPPVGNAYFNSRTGDNTKDGCGDLEDGPPILYPKRICASQNACVDASNERGFASCPARCDRRDARRAVSAIETPRLEEIPDGVLADVQGLGIVMEENHRACVISLRPAGAEKGSRPAIFWETMFRCPTSPRSGEW
jgi:hypothetical protein